MSNSKPTVHYRVIRGSIRRPRATSKGSGIGTAKDFFLQGDLLPDGVFTAADIKSWLNEGRIESAQVSIDQARVASERIRARGKWRCDPSSLVGKSLEDMQRMVTEIDSSYDQSHITDEVAAVRLLTSDWDPRYSEPIAPVSDRSRPTALVAHDIKQNEDGSSATSSRVVQPSPKADEALAAAKEAAQAPVETQEPEGSQETAQEPEQSEASEVSEDVQEAAQESEDVQEAAQESEDVQEAAQESEDVQEASQEPEQSPAQERIAEIRARKAEAAAE